MIISCLACGISKNSSIKEVYPYPEDGLIEDPIDPLMVIDCQSNQAIEKAEWRAVIVCHDCFHRLDVDMWISIRCWQALNPVLAFDELPMLSSDKSKRHDVEHYTKLTNRTELN